MSKKNNNKTNNKNEYAYSYWPTENNYMSDEEIPFDEAIPSQVSHPVKNSIVPEMQHSQSTLVGPLRVYLQRQLSPKRSYAHHQQIERQLTASPPPPPPPPPPLPLSPPVGFSSSGGNYNYNYNNKKESPPTDDSNFIREQSLEKSDSSNNSTSCTTTTTSSSSSSQDHHHHHQDDHKWAYMGFCYLRLWLVYTLALFLLAAILVMLGIIITNNLRSADNNTAAYVSRGGVGAPPTESSTIANITVASPTIQPTTQPITHPTASAGSPLSIDLGTVPASNATTQAEANSAGPTLAPTAEQTVEPPSLSPTLSPSIIPTRSSPLTKLTDQPTTNPIAQSMSPTRLPTTLQPSRINQNNHQIESLSFSPMVPPSLLSTLSPSMLPTERPTPKALPQSAQSSLSPSLPSQSDPESDQTESQIFVGAYYYPWHSNDFHGGSYLRGALDPRQQPLLGEYDDTDPAVIAQHLQWSRQANIRFWVTSWWGQGRREDLTTRNVILEHPDLGDHKIALFYETTGRIKNEQDMDSNILEDISYICDNYFTHPNYLYVNGRPALFVYITRQLEQNDFIERVVLLMRSVASNYGYDIWLAGDHVWNEAPEENELFKPFLYLDGVTNYDIYGNMGATGYAGQAAVNRYYRQQETWKLRANDLQCGYIPAVNPGYNDRAVRLEADHEPLSRRLKQDLPEGSLFEAALQNAVKLIDPTIGNLLIVNSFNEWHEDSQIEPVVAESPATGPFELTKGLEYEGYGDLYLRLLGEATRNL